MLETMTPIPRAEKELRKQQTRQGLRRLSGLQLSIRENKLPVIVLVEGWSAAGKGSVISELIQELDPRFYNVISFDTPTETEKRHPWLWRYFTQIPAYGKIQFLDAGWMEQTARDYLEHRLSQEEFESRQQSIRRFERQLCDDGYLLVRLFLHISAKEQKKRLDALEESPDTSWRVGKFDRWQNEHYPQVEQVYDQLLQNTQTDAYPWHIIDASNTKSALPVILDLLCGSIEQALAHKPTSGIAPTQFSVVSMPPIASVPLDKTISKKEYKKQLKHYQNRLKELHNRLYRRRIPVIIAYEGWDAAGKGGNIRRIANALDARGFEVHPIASPTPDELHHQYLWRFWKRLPKNGHIAIFDRTWYGRVMVERIEGFCTEQQWKRAYTEMNEFEEELMDWGAVVVKFWIHIDPDTQLERFTLRQNTPEKRWKITDEDWRNREKWPQYEQAVDEMLQKTSTARAPWHIIESKDKRYARIKAMKILVEAIEQALEKDKRC